MEGIVLVTCYANTALLTTALLTTLFTPFCPTKIHVRHDFATGAPQGEAEVTFASKEVAATAARVLDGTRVDGEALSVSELMAPPEERVVVVVGAGLAGTSAALTAADEGAHVVLLDKTRGGGNSAKASSGMNAAGSDFQAAAGISDAPQGLIDDTMASAKGEADPKLVHKLAHESAEAVAWLASAHDVHLAATVACGGHSVARTHRVSPGPADAKPVNVGWAIMSKLLAAVKTHPNITYVANARVTSLLSSPVDPEAQPGLARPSPVRGVAYEIQTEKSQSPNDDSETIPSQSFSVELPADAVILATGGYSASAELLATHAPHVAGLPTTNGAFASGEGLGLAESAGGLLAHLDKVQVHPTGFVDLANPEATTKFLAPEALRGYGGVLISPTTGAPFVDALETRDVVSQAINEACAPIGGSPFPVALLVMGQDVASGFNPAIFNFYVSKNLIHAFDSVSAAESWADATLGAPASFGSAFGDHVSPPGGPVYVALVTPSVHYTMGGVSINTDAAVIHGSTLCPIPGLFAAGEVTTGVHGANRLAGNSLLECIVYGRTAGISAVHACAAIPTLSPTEWTPLALESATPLSNSSTLFRFALPSPCHVSGLGLGDYIAVRGTLDGEQVVRFYSPMSRDDVRGHIDLCIKIDCGPTATMSSHFASMVPGDILEFQGPKGGPHMSSLLYSDKKTHVGLLAGGTGIAPMLQFVRAALLRERKLGQSSPPLDMTLMYAAKNEEEILLKEALENHAAKHPSLSLFYSLMEPPQDWTMGTGFITADMIATNLAPPADHVFILICGPPPFCNAMKSALDSLGYVAGTHYYSYM